ncbi:MAG: hypothetical protein CVU71_07290 [Deltaproteobacteria bacterium HGW-Deltaproteobacteria-6]|jgi:hypothetical protein|nr:MAG: hypothetical protein CVU71_07290 [Deltaproteobacteria bacterium HGW-Deltaproteobacteria-6]
MVEFVMSPDLYYTNNDGRVDQIGEWAGWFDTAGEAIGSSIENNRFVLGLALPVRPFAALFLALGIIKGRESSTNVQSPDNSEYFEYLENLPTSTNVTFLMKDKEKLRQRVGNLSGIFADSSGRKAIKVRYADDRKKKLQLTRCFYTYNCHDISILSQDSIIDISNYRKKGQSVIKSQDFLSAFVPDVNVSILALTSRFDCLLVSTKKRLSFELDFNFSLKKTKSKTFLQGTLKDIIRPRNNTLYSGSYRSLICPVNMKKPPEPDGIQPWCIIFDSADGYLKWHQLFENSHQIVILDRAEKRFKEAAAHINQRYYNRADSLPAFIRGFLPTLTGIETICFNEN